MLTNEEIKQFIEGAFKPFICGAKIFDYEKKVRFQAFESIDKPIAACSGILLSSVRDARELAAVLQQKREEVTAKGFVLLPWSIQ